MYLVKVKVAATGRFVRCPLLRPCYHNGNSIFKVSEMKIFLYEKGFPEDIDVPESTHYKKINHKLMLFMRKCPLLEIDLL